MKGLAKRNNKTRGKTTRKRKNNRKTIRKGKKRGGNGSDRNGFANFQSPKRYTDAEINTMKETANNDYLSKKSIIIKKFNGIVDVLEQNLRDIKFNGAEETKNDENEQPNKKKRTNNTTQDLAKAEDLINFKYMKATNARAAELQQLNTNGYEKMKEISEIEQNEREARETERIEERNYQTAMQKAKEEGLSYLPVESPGKGDQFSQEEDLHKTAAKFKKQDDEDFNNGNVLTFNGGKKRKTHKKRK